MSNRSARTTSATIHSSPVRALFTLGLALASLAVASGPVTAAPPPKLSWNLSRDLLTNMGTIQTPTSPWKLGEMPSGGVPNNTSAFVPFTTNALTNCWGTSSPWFACWFTTTIYSAIGGGSIGMSTMTGPAGALTLTHGVPMLHPGSQHHVAVKWTNLQPPQTPPPPPLQIEILGRLSKVEPSCSNGVNYHVLQGTSASATALTDSFTGNPLGNVPLSNNGDVFQASASVNANDSIYLVIDSNGSYYCDSTELDILIVTR